MAKVSRNIRLVIGLLVNGREKEKISFAKKKIETDAKLACSVNLESNLDIPTFIRQGRVLSHL